MIRVGVLRGGKDEKYKRSLDNGGVVLNCIRNGSLSQKYKAVDIFIDEDGVWHLNGIPVTLEKLKTSVDVVVNALLGKYSESGDIQKKLEDAGILCAFSDFKSSCTSHDKYLTKIELIKNKIKTPHFVYFPYEYIEREYMMKYQREKASEVLLKIAPPWIIKPVSNGSSVGVVVCKTFEELVLNMSKIFENKDGVLVEEFIKGKEGTVGVINDFRNKDFYVLPSVQIFIPKENFIFDKNLKESNFKIACPGIFTEKEKEEIEYGAKTIHQKIGLDFYSKIDFIVHPKRGVYFIEVNSQSEFFENSFMVQSLESVGSNLGIFLDHIISKALKKRPI